MFPSPSLVEGGCYPNKGSPVSSKSGREQWEAFQAGTAEKSSADALAKHWFRTYDRDELENLWLTEEYLPVPVMDTLLVLLTVDEEDLFRDDEDEETNEDVFADEEVQRRTDQEVQRS